MLLALAWVAALIGVPGIIFGGIQLRILIKSTAQTDQEKQEAKVMQRIHDAVLEERTRCSDKVNRINAELTEMTRDRDSERTQRIENQSLINRLMLNRGGGGSD